MSNNNTQSVLSFQLGNELLGVDVQKVLEVLRNKGVTPIPRSEDFVRGIVQFRGEIVTVIDFSEKLNLYNNAPTSGNVVIVFQITNTHQPFKVGILADSVKAVDELTTNQIKPVEEMNHYFNPEYLQGIYKKDNDFIVMLDIEKIFSEKDIQIIKNTANN